MAVWRNETDSSFSGIPQEISEFAHQPVSVCGYQVRTISGVSIDGTRTKACPLQAGPGSGSLAAVCFATSAAPLRVFAPIVVSAAGASALAAASSYRPPLRHPLVLLLLLLLELPSILFLPRLELFLLLLIFLVEPRLPCVWTTGA